MKFISIHCNTKRQLKEIQCRPMMYRQMEHFATWDNPGLIITLKKLPLFFPQSSHPHLKTKPKYSVVIQTSLHTHWSYYISICLNSCIWWWVMSLWLPLLAHCCFIVSISTPESLAFLMADVARGQPDRLKEKKKTASRSVSLGCSTHDSIVPFFIQKIKRKVTGTNCYTKWSGLLTSAIWQRSPLAWFSKFSKDNMWLQPSKREYLDGSTDLIIDE